MCKFLSLFLLFLASQTLKATPPTSEGYLLDDFEKNLHWETKEWADGAQLELSTDAVTEGKQSLRASFSPSSSKGQKKFVLRRSLGGKAQNLQEIWLDVFNPLPTPGVEVALALEADEYYETDKISLKQGWNRDLSFRIDSQKLKSKSSDWEYRVGIPANTDIGSLYILLHTGEANAGSFHIDRLRSRGKPVIPKPRRRIAASITTAPRWKGIATITPPSQVYSRIELEPDFEALYHDPFDPKEIRVEATFKAPSGKTYRIDGFFYEGEVSLDAAPQGDKWRLRFTPMEPGSWSYHVAVSNPKGEAISPTQTFVVAPGTSEGFLRVDAKDPHYFSFDSGRFYYPIGQNAAWGPQEFYRKLFPTMKANGQNWTRLWMSHWSFGIEWKEMGHYRGIGNYNLETSKRLDEVLELMEKNGVYAQLVFEFHGALSSKVNPEWPNNPYNKAQGGPLAKAQQFFTEPAVKELYKRRLRYIVARWGYSPNIMAWELFNEISFADDFSIENDYLWHKEMSRWLKENDPYQHMVTTSYYDTYNKKTYALPSIDFTQYHAYHQNVWKTMSNIVPRFRAFGKPFFFGEFGSDSADGVDAQDKQGVFIHAGIWTQAMQPVAGNAMPWWWDTLIEPHQLYRHFAALSRFLEGIDRRGKSWQPLQEKWPLRLKGGQSETLSYYGLQSPELLMGWICDVKGMKHGDRAAPQEFRGIQFYTRPTRPGRYRIEYWDTQRGLIVTSQELDTDKSGRLLLSLPPFKNDVAFKVFPS